MNARTTGLVPSIRDLGGADVAISLATSPRAFEQAFGSLRRGGRLVCVALPADDKMTVPIFDTVIGGKSIIGSIGGTRKDLADVFALHAPKAGEDLLAAGLRYAESLLVPGTVSPQSSVQNPVDGPQPDDRPSMRAGPRERQTGPLAGAAGTSGPTCTRCVRRS